MILSFRDAATHDLFHGRDTKAARKRLPHQAWRASTRKLDQLNYATALKDLRIPPGNRLELLRGDRVGQHSIRINDQYRICFKWTPMGSEQVEEVDYH